MLRENVLKNNQKTALAVAVGFLCASGAYAKEAVQDQRNVQELKEVTITATRSEADVNSVPQSVTIIRREQLEEQVALGSGLGDILGKLVPGFAVGRESPSTFTQTLRGRNINVMIDGVPQSTNRNGARILTLIDPSAIERIEVIRGATSIYGDGATGGAVNIITRQGQGGAAKHVSEIGANTSLTHPKDSIGTLLRHTVSGSREQLDYLATVSAEKTGAFFDAQGDRIPPAGAGQGSLAETRSYNVLGKLGYQLDPMQRLQLTLNTYKAEQDTNYTTDPSVTAAPLRGHKAQAISGMQVDKKEGTENLLANLDYHHKDLLGSKVHGQLFYRDYKTVYSPFQRHDGTRAGPAVFQSFIESQKGGGRLEFDTLLSDKYGVMMTWGADYIDETTSQSGYVHDLNTFLTSGGRVFRSTGETRVWVPPYNVKNKGAFSQLEWQATGNLLFRGGVRYETVDVSVNDFTTLTGGQVRGGQLRYNDTLYNIGAVYNITANLNVFGSFNQGFSLPDMGLVLRNAANGSSFGTLNTKQQKVDNYEVGVRGAWRDTRASLALFYSENELGARSGGMNAPIVRAPEKIYGIEATLDQKLSKALRAGGTFSWTEGKRYDASGNDVGYLRNDAISPLKLTAYVEHDTMPDWTNRVQVTYSGKRDRFGGDTSNTYQNPIDDYAVVDWLSQKRLSKQGKLVFGINNLFNKQYHNVFAQTVVTPGVYDNTRYAASTGATAHISYKHAW